MKTIDIIYNNKKYELEITEKAEWNNLTQEQKNKYEANGQYQYEGKLFYITKSNKRLTVPSFTVEGASEEYIHQEVNNWLEN